MTFKHKILIISLLAICGWSCSSEENSISTGLGWIQFNLTVDEVASAEADQPFMLQMSTADDTYSRLWPDINDFNTLEGYYAGTYRALVVSGNPADEGYGVPCYRGETTFEVVTGKRTSVPISCSLVQALLRVNLGKSLLAAYPQCKATMHSTGHGYVEVNEEISQHALMVPGMTQFYITLSDNAGREITVAPDFAIHTIGGTAYDATIDLQGSDLTIKCGDFGTSMPLSEKLFTAAPPQIDCSGFMPSQELKLTEGYPASEPVIMTINADAGVYSATLTSVLPQGTYPDFPEETNLVNAPSAVTKAGLQITRPSDEQLSVDFSKMLEDLAVSSNSSATFTLQARDRLGRVTQPITLSVIIKSVDVTNSNQTRAMIGINEASVALNIDADKIETKDFSVYITDANGNAVRPTPLLSASFNKEQSIAELTFSVGDGNKSVPVRIDYLGNPKLYTVIEREVPDYAINVDPFATTAVLYFDAGNPVVTEALIEYAAITANGRETTIMRREPQNGMIVVSGLAPNTTYTLQSTVVKDQYAPTLRITTESAAEIPTGDFEDVDVLFTYDKLPSGGVYSSSAFPVYTQQNTTDFKVFWPQKHWASVNAKTFCTAAANHNTWYMQPSAMIDYSTKASGSKSMKLVSVGWSLDGPEIMPYQQEQDSYLPYNANVPYVDHRSAGRVFLGEYKFDPNTLSESYVEGLTFKSRPSSLNGFYKYTPDPSMPNDYGVAIVELLNEDSSTPTVIASAKIELHTAPDFVSFNLPLDYFVINLKATRLKIMFSSSRYMGTIEEEDISIPTTANVKEAKYSGSELWIDNLTFSY